MLKGGEAVFSLSSPALICEVHTKQALEWIEDWLTEKGYTAKWEVPARLFPRLLLASHPLPTSTLSRDADEPTHAQPIE